MAETKQFDATIIRRGGYRELRQAIRYECGRAVAYRCPDCHDLHPLTPRDWDEARGVYAGRDCGADRPVRANSRAGRLASERRRYASDEARRAAKRAYARAYHALRAARAGTR